MKPAYKVTSTHIRPMTPQDIPSLADWMPDVPLWQRYGLTAATISRNFQDVIDKANLDERLYAVEANGDDLSPVVCGFAWVVMRGAFGRSAYLKQIGIHPAYTGIQLGGKLLDFIEIECTKTTDQLFLLVSDFNRSAQRFYQRRGYEQVGAIPAYVLPDVTELIYRKRIG